MPPKDSASDKVAALRKRIETGVLEVFRSGQYQEYLDVMSKFHHYSARNCALILMQRPDATQVAGFNAWRDKFHRYVRKGEHGIQILAYAPRSVEKIRPIQKDGHPVKDENGEIKTETVTITVPSYLPVYVFDVSQTDGEPLPELTHQLEGRVEDYPKMFAAIEAVSPFPIQFQDTGSAFGFCSFANQEIGIKPGLSELHTIKTAIHEVAHARLHEGANLDRSAKEIQAESVAYIVSNYYGLDTSDYSFSYVAGWSQGYEVTDLTAILDEIQGEAHQLIEEIDQLLANPERLLNQEKALDSSISAPLPLEQSEEKSPATVPNERRSIKDVVADAKKRASAQQTAEPFLVQNGERSVK